MNQKAPRRQRKMPQQPNRFDKPRHFKLTLQQLLRYLARERWVILASLLAAALGTVCTILGPNILKDMTNEMVRALPGKGQLLGASLDFAVLGKMGAHLLALYLAAAALNLLQAQMMVGLSGRISLRMRRDIAEKINRMPLSYFDGHSHGDILSRVTNDIDVLSQVMTQSLGSIVSTLTVFAGALLLMLVNSWILALCAVAASVFGFAAMTLIISRTQKFFLRQQNELGELNGQIEEVYSGHEVVRANNGLAGEMAAFSEVNDRLYHSAWKSRFFSGLMMPLMNFVGNLGYVVVSVVGAALAAQGKISFGVIVAFMVYVRLFSSALAQTGQLMNVVQMGAAAGERVFDFLNEKELSDESHKKAELQKVQGSVSFENVRFGYLPEKTIIHNFSAAVQPGQKIAIVGPTGAGKTTLVNLLMRFYEVDSGEIRIDERAITELKREEVHKQFAMVLQDTWIFDGSIRDNIVFNQSDISDETVIRACKAVGMHRYIQTLPEAYDTVLNENSSLSEGQKQLLTIARAMVRNAPLLILDEATSSVDTRTERRVQKAMDELMQGRTSFVIAHRLSTIKNADLILVLQDGDIVEKGKHEELLRQNGFYADLYRSQFELGGAAPAASTQA